MIEHHFKEDNRQDRGVTLRDNIVRELEARSMQVNYATALAGNRLLYLGESHPHTQVRRHLTEKAGELKAAGITHYAIEASRSGLGTLARLEDDPDTDLSRLWDLGPNPNDRAGYESVIRAVARCGIKVVPIDTDRDVDSEIRESELTSNLLEILSDSDSKVAVLIGMAHTYKPPRQTRKFEWLGTRIAKKGISATTVVYTGLGHELSDPLSLAIRSANPEQREIMFDIGNFPALLTPSYLRHLGYIVRLPS